MSEKYRKSFNNYSLSRSRNNINAGRLKQSRQYFSRKKITRIRSFSLIFLIVLTLLAAVYHLFFSDYSRLDQIKISKTSDYGLITEQEVRTMIASVGEIRVFFIPRDNFLFFRKKSLGKIFEQDSRIQDFTIKKEFPHTLLTTVAEAKPVAVLISFAGVEGTYLNSEGEVIYANHSNFTTPGQRNLPVFYDQTEISLDTPEYIMLFKAILKLIDDIWQQNDIQVKTVKISEKGGIFEVEITTDEQWRILINSEADFEKQESNLNLILKEEDNNRDNLEQIDLRFGEKYFLQTK